MLGNIKMVCDGMMVVSTGNVCELCFGMIVCNVSCGRHIMECLAGYMQSGHDLFLQWIYGWCSWLICAGCLMLLFICDLVIMLA